MTTHVRNAFNAMSRVWQLVREEMSFHVPWPTRLKAWRHGFLGRAGVLYDWRTHGWSAYLPDTVRFLKTPLINGPWRAFTEHKLFFSQWLESLHPGITPKVYGLMAHGGYHPVPGRGINPNSDSLEATLRRQGRLILKPEAGGGGQGVVSLEWRDGACHWNNERLGDPTALAAKVGNIEDGLVLEHLSPGSYARAIEPSGLHTMRILSLWEKNENRPFIGAAVQRLATVQSGLVDNWAKGGLSVAVNLETGMLGAAVRFNARTGEKQVFSHHPDTWQAITGTLVPGWSALQDLLRQLARELPWLPYLGWDVMMTDEGPRIIEANGYTGVTLFQVHAPLLNNPRIRDFYTNFCPGFRPPSNLRGT